MNGLGWVKLWWCIALACILGCMSDSALAGNVEIIDDTLGDYIDTVIHKPSLVYDCRGNPRVAYKHPRENSLKYAWSDNGGETWNITTVDDACAVDLGVSLALDGHDNPRIAYTLSGEGYSGCLRYAASDDNGESWRIEKLSDAGQYPVSLFLNGEDNPLIVFMESIEGGPLVLLRSDDGGWSWIRNIVDDGRSDDLVGWGLSLACDEDGGLHITYFNQPGWGYNKLKHAYSGDLDWYWDKSNLDTPPEPIAHTSIALDSYGDRHIVYSAAHLPEDPDEAVLENIYYTSAPEQSDRWETDELEEVREEGLPTIHLINNTPVIAYQSAREKVDGYIKIMRLFGGEWVTEGMIDSSPFGDADFDPCWTASDAFSKKHRLGIVFVDKGVFCNDNYQPLLAYFSCNIPPEIKVTSEDDVEELKNGEQTLDFGEVLVGTASKPIEFFVQNTGKSGLIIDDIEIGGSDFHVREKTMDGSQGKKRGDEEIVAELQPLDDYNFSIVFVPTKPGLIEAVVRLRNNDPDENPFTFTVAGTGFLPPREF